MKIGTCPSKCDRKDLMHAIESTFGRVIISKMKGDFFRLKVQLDAQKSLRRGVFVTIGTQGKTMVSFKYENLPNFCFGCWRMGHKIKDYCAIPAVDREKSEDELPYSLTFKAKLNLIGKESLKFGFSNKKLMKQRFYTGLDNTTKEVTDSVSKDDPIDRILTVKDRSKMIETFGKVLIDIGTPVLAHNCEESGEIRIPTIKDTDLKLMAFTTIIIDDEQNVES